MSDNRCRCLIDCLLIMAGACLGFGGLWRMMSYPAQDGGLLKGIEYDMFFLVCAQSGGGRSNINTKLWSPKWVIHLYISYIMRVLKWFEIGVLKTEIVKLVMNFVTFIMRITWSYPLYNKIAQLDTSPMHIRPLKPIRGLCYKPMTTTHDLCSVITM
jgi:hypothetical protein